MKHDQTFPYHFEDLSSDSVSTLEQEVTQRQTLFFTATWNTNVQKIASDFVNRPYQVPVLGGFRQIFEAPTRLLRTPAIK